MKLSVFKFSRANVSFLGIHVSIPAVLSRYDMPLKFTQIMRWLKQGTFTFPKHLFRKFITPLFYYIELEIKIYNLFIGFFLTCYFHILILILRFPLVRNLHRRLIYHGIFENRIMRKIGINIRFVKLDLTSQQEYWSHFIYLGGSCCRLS